MVAPVITFMTGSATTGTAPPAGAFNMAALGNMATVFDFGTIDTGSSGSNTWFWIWNNYSYADSVANAILSSSTANALGLGHHESGSASHTSESSYSWSLQSGSLTGSVFAISGWSVQSSSAAFSSGAIASNWMYIYSGSSGTRLPYPVAGGILSGSASTAASGSAWLVGIYINMLNTMPQGQRTGSLCIRYQYT